MNSCVNSLLPTICQNKSPHERLNGALNTEFVKLPTSCIPLQIRAKAGERKRDSIKTKINIHTLTHNTID